MIHATVNYVNNTSKSIFSVRVDARKPKPPLLKKPTDKLPRLTIWVGVTDRIPCAEHTEVELLGIMEARGLCGVCRSYKDGPKNEITSTLLALSQQPT
jgi:hypothetical protein